MRRTKKQELMDEIRRLGLEDVPRKGATARDLERIITNWKTHEAITRICQKMGEKHV